MTKICLENIKKLYLIHKKVSSFVYANNNQVEDKLENLKNKKVENI